MIKIIDDKNPMTVEFKTTSNTSMPGTLLSYEISGEACILIGSDKVWIPFSELSKTSQRQVIGLAVNDKGKTLSTLREPKLFIIVTLLVLIVFSYYYCKFSF